MCVECGGHIEQRASSLHARQERMHAILELPRLAVNLLRLAFSRLCQLVGRGEEFVGVRYRVLKQSGDSYHGASNSGTVQTCLEQPYKGRSLKTGDRRP